MNIKTTMTKSILGLSLLLATISPVFAQEATSVRGYPRTIFETESQDLSELPKMERDIVILQNVLNDLISPNGSTPYSSRGAKGMYIPGKGVIFNVSYGSRYGNILFAENLTIVEEQADVEIAANKTENSTKETNEKMVEKIENLSKEFLVNYGSILSELNSNEKVMLNVEYAALEPVEKNKTGVTVSPAQSAATVVGKLRLAYTGRSSNNKMVSSINYSDINSYLNGKLNLEQAMNKVTVTNGSSKASSAVDAKIMAGILDDLFTSNFDGKFRRSRKTTWNYFDGFGLMFELNMSGSRADALTFFVRDTQGAVLTEDIKGEKGKKEDKKNIEQEKETAENLDKLIDMAKESLVTYGRTLRSVKSNEVVILNINLGGTFGRLKLPKSVRLQVSKSQIEAYSKGQKSLEQLKQEIDTKMLKASASNFPTVQGYVNQAQSIYSTTPAPSGRVVIGQKAKGRN